MLVRFFLPLCSHPQRCRPVHSNGPYYHRHWLIQSPNWLKKDDTIMCIYIYVHIKSNKSLADVGSICPHIRIVISSMAPISIFQPQYGEYLMAKWSDRDVHRCSKRLTYIIITNKIGVINDNTNLRFDNVINNQPTKHKTVGVPAMCNGHQCGVRKCVASAIATWDASAVYTGLLQSNQSTFFSNCDDFYDCHCDYIYI